MAVFDYKAMDVDASTVAGTVAADTPRQARDALRDRGLRVSSLRPLPSRRAATFWERRRGRRAEGEVVAAVGELATLLGAGIPLLAAFDTLIRQHRGALEGVLRHLRDRVAAGAAVADAMADRPTHFDELSRSIVRVGESTGTLEAALADLASFKEKARRLRSRVTTALIYPAVVCVVGAAVGVFLMTWVVPDLLDAVMEAGRTPPLPTRILKGASDALRVWWWVPAGCAAGLAIAGQLALRSGRGRLAADRLVLRFPVVGDLVRKENTSRMAVVMAALLRSGLHFDEAIRITRSTVRNAVFRRALDDYEAAVTAGRDVAGPLEASGVFSPLVVRMLAVGQESGQLEDMLDRLSRGLDAEVAVASERLTALLEPLLIVVLAVLVGFVALATVLPILEASHVM